MQSTEAGSKRTYSPYWVGQYGDQAFREFTKVLQGRMFVAIEEKKLFSVDTEGLWDWYLNSFKDPVERQHHNCHCCRSFIRHYGGLVTLSENGAIATALWSGEDTFPNLAHPYRDVIYMMRREVENRSVKNQFFWKELVFGTPEAGGFSHFHVFARTANHEALLTPSQTMAAKREDRKHLEAALQSFQSTHVTKAVGMLESGELYRANQILPMAKFIRSIQERVKGVRDEERRNRMLWYAVGEAAKGWCTPRDSAFGALVDDVAAGKSLQTAKRAHSSRLDPLKYQRPQAAPAAGNIARAEKIVEQLGLERSLHRRPMALEEAELFWRPRYLTQKVVSQINSGVFSHIEPKNPPPPLPQTQLNSARTTMTFAKFERDVLPHALKVQFFTPPRGAYCAFTTAVYPDAPPILKWDSAERRNPGAWYFNRDRKSPWEWSLPENSWVEVLGMSKLPPDWYGNQFGYACNGRVLLILEGAADKGQAGLALFPECLKSELHEVRATIEKHSNSMNMGRETRQRASGYCIGENPDVSLDVTTVNGVTKYKIDRLE